MRSAEALLEAQRIQEATRNAARLQLGLDDDALQPGGAPCEVGIGYLDACTAGFSAERALGQPGAFGTAYRGVDASRSPPLAFAVKRLSNDAAWTAERSAAREIAILTRLRHPHIIRLFAYTTDPAQRCLVYELGERGALSDNLTHAEAAACLTPKLRVRILAGIASALVYMNRHPDGVAWHRDVKSANVVLTSGFEPKLIDCGLSKLLSPVESALPALTVTGRIPFGTPGYMCPKYMKGAQYSEAAEVFSFGVLALEVLTGQLQMGNNVDLVDEVVAEDELDTHCDERGGVWPAQLWTAASVLAAACVKTIQSRRPTMLAAFRALQELKQAHCVPTADESVLLQHLVAALKQLNEHRAAREEVSAETRRALRLCAICMEQATLLRGIECAAPPGAAPHFLCEACLAEYACDEAAKPPDVWTASGGHLRCPLHRNGCAAPPYAFSALARRLPEEAYVKVQAASLRSRERELVQRIEADVELRLRAELHAERQLASHARSVALARRHVEEDILCLRCPGCRRVVEDWDACDLVTCACAVKFCGWCFTRTADHAHVTNCATNPARGNVFSSASAKEAAQARRRGERVREFLATLEPQLRAELLSELQPQLRQLGVTL